MRTWLASRKERLSYVAAALLLLITLAAWAVSGVELRHLKTGNDQTRRLHTLGYAAFRSDRAAAAAAFGALDPAVARRLRPTYDALPASLPRFETAVDAELQRLSRTAHEEYPVARGALVSAVVASLLLMGVLLWQFLTQRRAGRIDRDNARLREEFVAVVSHELRTPLTSILGYVELIGDDEYGALSDDQQSYFEVVKRNADRLLHLVGDLLLVAENDNGNLRLDLRDVDLQSLVGDSVQAARAAAERKGVELTSSIAPASLQGDPVRLAQMLDNLVSNAIKYTPAGGRVYVRAGVGGGQVVLEVADSGIGIAPSERQRIFERFYRVRRSSGDTVTGAGLGLAITKAIVEAHGGSIGVESEVGSGTTFRIRLPLPAAVPVPQSDCVAI